MKQYCEIGYDNPSFLKCHGVSRDDKSKDYIIVLDYARKGSLRQNLPDVAQMAWKDKLNVLYSIVSDLESIHSQELVHRDLHSGNILQNHLHSAYITDLGLSVSPDIKQKEEINGVVPYVAPEVLMGKECTQAADIYSFGLSCPKYQREEEHLMVNLLTILNLRKEFVKEKDQNLIRKHQIVTLNGPRDAWTGIRINGPRQLILHT